jgi:hypothetical protein
MLRLFGLPTLILFELSLGFEASSHARFFAQKIAWSFKVRSAFKFFNQPFAVPLQR